MASGSQTSGPSQASTPAPSTPFVAGQALGLHVPPGPAYHALTPQRVAWGGSRKYVRYVPAWTDPDWKDNGPERENSEWKIRNGFMDRVRPAMLASDMFKNPTEYAKRFGIFPGNTDGRSRMSPTRATSRKVEINGETHTGKEVFEQLEGLANRSGKHVEDYLAEEKLDLKKMSESDQKFMQTYEGLLIDEFWQAMVLGNMTMSEVLADEYFSMKDVPQSELSGPLDRLLTRDRWVDTSQRKDDPKHPHYLYNIKGERGEFDPKLDDRVWDAMQPALQVATRILNVNDSFMDAARDVTNRTKVDPWLETRTDQGEVVMYPNFKFKRYFDEFDPLASQPARQLRNIPGIDPQALTWKALDRMLRFKLADLHYCQTDGKFRRHGPLGVTQTCRIRDEGYPIEITLDATLIWYLMSDECSESEKMMNNLVLGQTIAHEMLVCVDADVLAKQC